MGIIDGFLFWLGAQFADILVFLLIVGLVVLGIHLVKRRKL